MPVLDNPRHERFCQERAKGKSADEAYQLAGYKRDRGAASRLSAKVNVTARITELQSLAADDTVMSIAEKRKFLADIKRTPIGEIDEMSPLCQEWTYEQAGGPRGRLKRGDDDEGNEEYEEERQRVKVKMPDKLRAIQLDNDLAVDGAEAGKNKAIEIIFRE